MNYKLILCLIALFGFVLITTEARYLARISRDSGEEEASSQSNELDFLNSKKIQNKRGFDIKTFYSPVLRKDGSLILMPKDINKNHYFIG